MAEQPKESEYAARLRELGFRPLLFDKKAVDRVTASLRERLDSALPKPTLGENKPSFFYSQTGVTVARDEFGVRWFAKGHIDLASLGFANAMPGMAALADLFQKLGKGA